VSETKRERKRKKRKKRKSVVPSLLLIRQGT
jgi:hypothetical protein